MSSNQSKNQFQSGSGNYDEDDDLDQDFIDILTPFEFEDHRSKVAKEMDNLTGAFKEMIKLGIGIAGLIVIYILLFPAFKFIVKIGIEIFNWLDKLF